MLSVIPAPPPIEDDPTGEVVDYFGFPVKDGVKFHHENVDPSWKPAKGEEPNFDMALFNIKRTTGYQKMLIATVWEDAEQNGGGFMLAVASASKKTRIN